MIETQWKLTADVQDTYTGNGGSKFVNVVRTIHWQCIALDGENMARIYGSMSLPLPTDTATYIDLTKIAGADEATRKATILGWAEMLKPGFVATAEAEVTASLQSSLTKPTTQSWSII